MFFISAAIYIFGWLSYVTVVKGHVLPWAKTPETLDIVAKEVSAINTVHIRVHVSEKIKIVTIIMYVIQEWYLIRYVQTVYASRQS